MKTANVESPQAAYIREARRVRNTDPIECFLVEEVFMAGPGGE